MFKSKLANNTKCAHTLLGFTSLLLGVSCSMYTYKKKFLKNFNVFVVVTEAGVTFWALSSFTYI